MQILIRSLSPKQGPPRATHNTDYQGTLIVSFLGLQNNLQMQPFMFSSLFWHLFPSRIPWRVVPSYSYHTKMPEAWAGKTSNTEVLSLKWFTIDKKMYKKMWMMMLGFFKSKPILTFTKVVNIWQPSSTMSLTVSKLFLNKLLRSQRQVSLLGGNLSSQGHQLQRTVPASLFKSGPLREEVSRVTFQQSIFAHSDTFRTRHISRKNVGVVSLVVTLLTIKPASWFAQVKLLAQSHYVSHRKHTAKQFLIYAWRSPENIGPNS